MDNLISVGELAKRIGVKEYQIIYAHKSGKVPEPAWVMGRRAYDEEAAQRVREYFVKDAQRRLEALQAVACINI